MQQNILFLGFLFLSASSSAMNIDHPCMNYGSSESEISSDVRRVNGGETGIFFRETFQENLHQAIQSCMSIPKEMDQLDLPKIFGINPKTNKINQTPFNYFGISLNDEQKMYEGGLYYHEASQAYIPFTANFNGKRMSSDLDQRFMPGDRVCFSLSYDDGVVEFKILKNGSTQYGAPMLETVSYQEKTLRNAWKTEFKRVTGIATRHTENSRTPGANGGIDSGRYEELKKDGVFSLVEWSDSYLMGKNGTPYVITSNAYDFSSGSRCTKTALWPKVGLSVEEQEGRLRVKLISENVSP